MWVLLVPFLIYLLVTVNRLDQQVKKQDQVIRKMIEYLKTSEPVKARPHPEPTKPQADSIVPASKPKKAPVFFQKYKQYFTVESIINKVGIGLLLIGIGFFLKLAYDYGYITESLAVILGLMTGSLLLGLAHYVKRKTRVLLSEILFGGGVATLYISLYAANQMYALIGTGVTLVGMCFVTLLAFYLAFTEESLTLSITGLLGGLITPFIVDMGFLGMRGVGIYLLFLTVTMLYTYYKTHWAYLFLVGVIGTFYVTHFLALQHLSLVNTHLLIALILCIGLMITITEAFMTHKKQTCPPFWIRRTIFLTTPIWVLIQINGLVYLGNWIGTLSYAITAAIYASLFWFLSEHRIESNLFAILTVFFISASIIASIGGAVLWLSIGVLSLGYYIISNRMDRDIFRILGHISLSVASLSAMIQMVFHSMDLTFSGQLWLPTFIMCFVLIFAFLLNKGLTKSIMATAALIIYNTVFVVSTTLWLFHQFEPFAASLLAYAVYMSLLLILERKYMFFSRLAYISMVALPLILRLFYSLLYPLGLPFNAYVSLAFLLNGFIFYGLFKFFIPQVPLKTLWLIERLSLLIVSVVFLIDLWVWADYFGYGLVLFGGLLWLTNPIGRYKELVWGGLFGFYILTRFLIPTESVLFVLTDLVLLYQFYVLLKSAKLNASYKLGLHSVSFMILVSLNIHSGATTLLWATYAAIALVLGVLRKEKSMVNTSLFLIVFIASKFIFIDLNTLEPLWKIVTAILFGAGLLTLSYYIQPKLKE